MSRQAALGLLGIAILAALSFAPAFGGDFVWDDRTVTQNPLLTSLEGLRRIWFDPRAHPYEAHYWPLTYTSFWIEHRLFGLNPLPYHVTNVLLHGASALLIWRILHRAAFPGAWFAGALFAVHPVHVESVAWVVERKDVLSLFLYLAAFASYVAFAARARGPAEGGRRRFLYGACLVLFSAAMLAKSVAISLPLALGLWTWWRRGKLERGDVLRLLPLALLAATIALLDVSYAATRDPVSYDFSILERVQLAGRAFWFYAEKMAFPASLSIEYPLFSLGADRVLAYLYPLAAIAAAVAAFAARRRFGRGLFAALSFYALSLAPTLGFIDFGFMGISHAADRFQYLASIGPIVLFAGAAASLSSACFTGGSRAPAVLAAGLLLALTAASARQSAHWRSDQSLFEISVERNPLAFLSWINLGIERMERGELDLAIDDYHRSLEARELNPKAHYNLGLALARSGRHTSAVEEFRRAVESAPGYYEAYNNLGAELSYLGFLDDAEPQFGTAIRIDPERYAAHMNLGYLLGKRFEYGRALKAFERVLRIQPDSLDAYHMTGACRLGLEEREAARAIFEEVLRRDPTYESARAQLEEMDAEDAKKEKTQEDEEDD